MHVNSTARQPLTKPSLPERGSESGYANMPVTKVPGWHGIIAWDALLNGMATGLFMAAAVSELAAPAVFTAVAKVAYPVALVLLLVDLGLLVLDLGDPLRFHHMLRTFKPGSPMSVGTWCLTIFSLPLTAAAAFSLLAELGMDFEWARILAVVVGLLPAFGSAAYKGVLLSTNAQPGWKDARWMGGYLSNSALLMGCGELLVLSALLGEPRGTAILRTAFIVLLVLNLIPLGLLLANLQATHTRLYTREQQWRVGALILAAGTLIPLGRSSTAVSCSWLAPRFLFYRRVGSSALCTSRYLTLRHWKSELKPSTVSNFKGVAIPGTGSSFTRCTPSASPSNTTAASLRSSTGLLPEKSVDMQTVASAGRTSDPSFFRRSPITQPNSSR